MGASKENPFSYKTEDDLVTVYRGTDSYMEQRTYSETNHLLSDATRNLYLENGNNLEKAYNDTEAIHKQAVNTWGNENNYVQAHGYWGTELERELGIPKTMMSVTTDPEVAKSFAPNTGMVYTAQIPRSQLIQQTIETSGESEYLIKYGSGDFKPYEPTAN